MAAAMRRAFTLLEILVVAAIIALMATASVLSVREGQAGARVRGAARDIFATIRHARSTALVTQQPSIITYSTAHDGEEVVAKIDIQTAKIVNDNAVKEATTLNGDKVVLYDDEAPKKNAGRDEAKDTTLTGQGETIDDVLFAPISSDVVRGIRVKVLRDGEKLEGGVQAREKPKISVFSNVDFLLGRLEEKKSAEKAKEKAEAAEKDVDASSSASSAAADDQEPVSIVWEANGRTEPHQVWIYEDGGEPEDGLLIRVDRFGAARVLSGDGREDD